MYATQSNYDPVPGQASINGQVHPQSIEFQVYYVANPVNEVSYNLGRDWRHFAATAGVTDDSTSGAELRFQIFIDGQEIYDRTLTYGESNPVTLNVTGVLRLTFKVSLLNKEDGTYIGAMGDAHLSN
ncbi:hypothetical protein GCM10010510_07950 [Streptomyces anandii JCM 4720]|nr:hypothetical protein GCM10010510_07950 [Streptomyces anandii JCM 4720]